MPILDMKYLKATCEIKTLQNKPLASGIISEISGDQITIKFNKSITVLDPNTVIKISMSNDKLGLKVLVGRVYVNTIEFLKVIELMTLENFEKRDYFRVEIKQKSKVYLEEITKEEINWKQTDFADILITDISLCGVFFQTRSTWEIGQELYVLLNFSSGETIIKCIVRRIDSSNQDYTGYGCELIGLDKNKSDQLYRYIFEKQLEIVKKAKENMPTEGII